MAEPTLSPHDHSSCLWRRERYEGSGGLWAAHAASTEELQLSSQRQHAYFTPPPPCPPTVVIPLRTNFYEPWGFSSPPVEPRTSSAEKRQKQYKTVFDRLTDSAFYTGVHRERFDELGNGRGLAGREYLYAHDGMTESPSRTHEVYSSVVKKPGVVVVIASGVPMASARKALVTPGTLGVQRFGLQTSPPRLLWAFRNGDKHHDGTPFFVKSHIKTLEALYQELTKVVTPIAGPVRRLFDQNLRLVVDVGDIVDGAKYLCTSGEPPACAERLQKFMSEWVVQKPQTKVWSEFFVV